MIINNKFKKPIICLETLEKFESIKDASRKLNIKRESIRDNCNHKRKNTHGLHFIFLSEYNQDIKYDLTIKKEAHNKKRIICLNDNLIFNSIKEASNFYHISTTGISKSIKFENKKICGYIFKEYEDCKK